MLLTENGVCLRTNTYSLNIIPFFKGAPSEFHEQTDLDGLNACQFLKLQKQLTGDGIDKRVLINYRPFHLGTQEWQIYLQHLTLSFFYPNCFSSCASTIHKWKLVRRRGFVSLQSFALAFCGLNVCFHFSKRLHARVESELQRLALTPLRWILTCHICSWQNNGVAKPTFACIAYHSTLCSLWLGN